MAVIVAVGISGIQRSLLCSQQFIIEYRQEDEKSIMRDLTSGLTAAITSLRTRQFNY
jgi:hypothetical protein